ncbi:MAG: hypothetical protein IPK72_08800 [Candidatus Eisenbacteria bacterium]|nr:hypothetical protein [Candidatus Eisenbacteria bacterium]
MVEIISHGKAAAGKLSPDAPCDGGLGLGIMCSGADAEAWYFAGRQWALHMRAALKALIPRAGDLAKAAPGLAAQIVGAMPGAAAAANEFSDDGPPLIALSGQIQTYVQAQQVLRDTSGLLDTGLAILGVGVAPAPKVKGEGGGGGYKIPGFGGDLVSGALALGGLYLAYSLFFKGKGS